MPYFSPSFYVSPLFFLYLCFFFYIYCKTFIPTLGPSIFSLFLACATLTLFLLTCHSGIRAITTVPHRPAARKKTNSSPYFSHNGPNSPSPGQAVSHCSELTGGVGGDSVGGGVPLISRASTFYSLRQFWLPLFGCQCKSGASGAIVSSGERTEQIGCTEQRERSEAVALLPSR